MHILALETSGLLGSVALLVGERLIAKCGLPPGTRSAQSLAPAIAQLLAENAWRTDRLELIAVSQGPGSFTGLRVGVTMAKTMAYALGCPVMGVDTLAAVAEETPTTAKRLHVLLDAQRGELCVALFAPAERGWTLQTPGRICTTEDWLRSLKPGDAVTGSGAAGLAERLPREVQAIESNQFRPEADTVGRMAFCQFQAGRRDDPWRLAPVYYRPSAAEERKQKA